MTANVTTDCCIEAFRWLLVRLSPLRFLSFITAAAFQSRLSRQNHFKLRYLYPYMQPGTLVRMPPRLSVYVKRHAYLLRGLAQPLLFIDSSPRTIILSGRYRVGVTDTSTCWLDRTFSSPGPIPPAYMCQD